MNTLKYLIPFIYLFLLITMQAQELKCSYCNKVIDAEYIVVDGHNFHKNHFKCANCNNQIKGEFYNKDGKYYDEKCYEKLFLPKCSVCNKPIIGEYLYDSFGYKIHKYHEAELKRCDNCNRIISENTTKGGTKYKDGRNICNICFGKIINSSNDYKACLKRVITRLKNYGLRFNEQTIVLKIVSLTELQKVSGNSYSKSIKGFTHSKIETFGSKKTFEHTVYILSQIPPKYAESTIAHELMHIWISENISNKL